MSKSEEMQAKMLKNIEEKTGLEPQVIIDDVKAQNLEKHNLKIAFIKEKYGLSHGFANLLALRSKEVTSYSSESNLIENQYRGKEELLPIYQEISNFLLSLKGTELAPKKAYVSVRAKKQYAIIQPSTKKRIDIGVNFPKDVKVALDSSGSFNSMVSNRIRIQKLEDFSSVVKEYLIKAYELSN